MRLWLCVLALLAALPAAPPALAQDDELCFGATTFCISGAIREYWERNGGVEVFGYPISEVRVETVTDGPTVWKGPVQWFERDRLEDHSTNRAGVLAGRLGALLLALRGDSYPAVAGAAPGCRFFEQTGHSLCEPFLSYWESNGELPRFGYPISEAISEQIGEKTYTVQYFERRRMENHSDEPGPQIALGNLGRDVFDRLCPGPEGPTLPPSPEGCPGEPPPPAMADVKAPVRSDQGYTVEITLNSSRPATIATVELIVLSPDNTVAFTLPQPYQPGQVLSMRVPAERLTEDGEYTLVVEAKAKDGAPIRTERGETALGTVKFRHTLAAGPATPTITVSVATVELGDGQDFLPVTLTIESGEQLEAQRDFINGTVYLYQDGLEILRHPVKGLDLEEPRIRVPLSSGMLKPEQEYELAVELLVPGLSPIVSDRLSFRPQPPNFWQRYVAPVVRSPVAVGGILTVLALVAAAIVFLAWPRQGKILSPVYSARTVLGRKDGARQAAPRRKAPPPGPTAPPHEAPLRLAVVHTSDQSQVGERLMSSLPCVVGREGADVLITGDTKVSRRHVEILTEGGRIMIKDLNSANGTAFVRRDDRASRGIFAVTRRLEKGATAEWDSRSLIRLGPNTVLELRPLAGQS